MENVNDVWQVEVAGQIYETNFEGLVTWIAEGSLLRGDKIRKGNLRWLEAGKIPSLVNYFEAIDAGQSLPTVQFSTSTVESDLGNTAQNSENFAVAQHFSTTQSDFQGKTFQSEYQTFENQTVNPENNAPHSDFCLIHTDAPSRYHCETCFNYFCKACPSGLSGTSKSCPMCGSVCKPLEFQPVQQFQNSQYSPQFEENLSFSDFGTAFLYPLKFKTSYIIGGIMFMLFTLGQQAAAIGGIVMFSASLTCFMLANMLTFGVLANVTENFSQGKIGGNFMPNFDDFSLWDSMIKPFFLTIGIYLVSFGLMIITIIGAGWYFASSMSEAMPSGFSNQPANARNFNSNPNFTQPRAINREEEEFQELEKMINQSRQAELESIAGKTPTEQNAQMRELFSAFAKKAGFFLLLIFLAFLWGVFYFPAACMVAGYTRSFRATINPSVGLDTIKRMGADYFKILGIGFLLVVFLAISTLILNVIFMPFELPKMGNLPAIAVGSWFTFYVSIVFFVVLGFALYKNAAKMNLFRS